MWLAAHFSHICNEIFKFSLCFAGQAAPGAFEEQVIIAPNSLLLALACGELWNSKSRTGGHLSTVILYVRNDFTIRDAGYCLFFKVCESFDAARR